MSRMPVIDYRSPGTADGAEKPDSAEIRQEIASIKVQLLALGVIAAASGLLLIGMKVLVLLAN